MAWADRTRERSSWYGEATAGYDRERGDWRVYARPYPLRVGTADHVDVLARRLPSDRWAATLHDGTPFGDAPLRSLVDVMDLAIRAAHARAAAAGRA